MIRLVALFSRYPRLTLLAGIGALFAVLCVEGLVLTVRPLGGTTAHASSPASGLAFDAKAYVARIWSTRVLPAARHDSTPLTELLAALAKGKSAALRTSSHRVSGSYNMLIRFRGKVSRIDTSSPIGTITVDVSDGTGVVPVKVATGPVILGTSLRDALKFISFGEFLNQIQYGEVADSLNSEVMRKVIAPLRLARLKGRTVSVSGAYTYDAADPRDITVTPVILTVGKAAP